MRNQLAYFIFLIIIVPVAVEGSLLLLGYRPFLQVPFEISSAPEYCIMPHQELGFALRPGQYRVTINEGLHYTVTHGLDSLRVTAENQEQDSVGTSIYFFGCSYTYGMGMADSLTLPFLVNAEKPGWGTKNFGVPGYGTVQSYRQLQQCIRDGDIPDIAIINYADFHDERNALTPAYRRDLYLGYQRANAAVRTDMARATLPFVAATPTGYELRACPWQRIYDNWSRRETFATVNLLQDIRDHRRRRQLVPAAITQHLFQQIQDFCTQNGIRLLVAGITRSPKTVTFLHHLEAAGTEVIDIAVDLRQNRYRNYPYDDHPNARTHALWARRISNYLVANDIGWINEGENLPDFH